MDQDSLLALFRKIAFATAPMLIGCSSYGDCPKREEITVPLELLHRDAAAQDAPLSDAEIANLCSQAAGKSPNQKCELVQLDGGLAVHVVYERLCAGRRPEGLCAPNVVGRPGAVGAWLAGTAYLEAASIDAFSIMAAELKAHGAPGALVVAASAAAKDERRHARMMGHLAIRRGARPPVARVVRRPIRELETIALENAVEGCVRETFAALVACHQARTARDPAIRGAMQGIAADEIRHASLSWAVDTWSQRLLGQAARRRTREARQAAVERLGREVAVSSAPALRDAAGLPDGDVSVRMASALFARLGC